MRNNPMDKILRQDQLAKIAEGLEDYFQVNTESEPAEPEYLDVVITYDDARPDMVIQLHDDGTWTLV